MIIFLNYRLIGNSALQVAKYLGEFQNNNNFHGLENKLLNKFYKTNKSISEKELILEVTILWLLLL